MFKGKYVSLRAVEDQEFERIHTWLNDENICKNLARYWPSTIEDIKVEYAELSGASLQGQMYAIDLQGEMIGFIKIKKIEWISRSGDLTIIIGDPQYQGKGYGSDAIRILLRISFELLHLHQVYLYVYEHNALAKQCYLACGFQVDGKVRDCRFIDGQYVSAIRMSILESEYWKKYKESVPRPNNIT